MCAPWYLNGCVRFPKPLQLLAASLMGACNPQLTFDDAVVVSCEEHGLCPAGHVCLRGQRCVDERALDPNGASPIVPGNDSILDLNDTLVFAWSTVANAQTYTLEVSTDAAFTSYVAGTPRVVEGTTHIATLPEGTYFWRVTADITAEGVPATAVRFGILGDALHVACPADVDCSAPNDGTLELGTAALPFHSINRGIREAAARGLGTVRVAKRPDGLAYQESVYLLQGLALEGGYGMDFGSREGRTKVALDDIGLRASSILAPTRVEHFDFERTGDASTTSVAVSITNSNDALVLADVRMSATTWRNAILDVRSSDAERGPQITGSEIEAVFPAERGDTPTTHSVVVVDNARLGIDHSRITARIEKRADGATLTVVGVKGQGGLTLDHSHIEALQVTGYFSTGIDTGSTSDLAMTDSTVTMSTAQTNQGRAILVSYAGDSLGHVSLKRSTLDVSAKVAAGIWINNRIGELYIDRSWVAVRSRSGSARGVDSTGAIDSRITSSFLGITGAADTTGISIMGGRTSLIAHNTVVVGSGTQQWGLYLSSFPHVRAVNNVIVAVGPPCVSSSCRVAVYDRSEAQGHTLDAATGNVAIGFTPNGGTTCGFATNDSNHLCDPFTANFDDADPYPYMAGNTAHATLTDAGLDDLLGTDGVVGTSDDAPRPAASSPLASGGHPTELDDCRPLGTMVDPRFVIAAPACGGVDVDYDGRAFTASPAVGAFQPL